MKKILLLLTGILILSSIGASQVNYRINAEKEDVMVNSSIKMDCTECPVERWQLSWQVPENWEIVSVEGSAGEAKDVDRNGETVKIKTETPPQDSEVIEIIMRIERDAERVAEGLYKRELSLPGFQDERTAVSVKNEELISGWSSFGFQSSFKQGEMRTAGQGPVNVRIKFGKGEETEYFEFFGYNPQGEEDQSYRIAVGTLGVIQEFQRFPVGVLPGEEYNRTVNRWSSGEYVSGSIRMREDLGDDFEPVLAHEVVHGLNDRFMKWDRTESSYFDEGTGKYVEYLQRMKLYREDEIKVGTAELFGEEKRYRVEENGQKYVYTVPPKGGEEKLWDYYESDKSFMKRWNPFASSENRRFGYAYSELIIRNHVKDGGKVREVYRKMNFSERVSDPDQKWEFFSQYLDMTPCKYDSRERFEQCLKEINEYNYPVYTSSPDIDSGEIEITEHELPEVEKETEDTLKDRLEQGNSEETKTKSSSDLGQKTGTESSRFFEALIKFISSILDFQ